jgi:hypothetical protein
VQHGGAIAIGRGWIGLAILMVGAEIGRVGCHNEKENKMGRIS